MKKYILIQLLLITIINSAYSNSSVEVKLELSETECSLNESIIYLDLFVKKADNVSEIVKLQNQNYRVSYNANTLEFDSFFIESEGQLSNYGNNPDQSFYLFAGHTLTGSTEHILSYNIDMQGGEGFELPNDWVLVGRVGARFKTNIECYSSVILTEETFPATTLIYSLDNNPSIVDKDPITIDVSDCVISHCNICNLNLDLNILDHNYTNGEILHHQVQDYIIADNIIGNNSQITFDVTNQALLKAGFEVKSSAVFEVKLDGCQ